MSTVIESSKKITYRNRNQSTLIVVSGSDEREFGKLHLVENLISHEKFNSDLENDIGLIKVRSWYV